MRTWCEDRNFASQKFRLTHGPVILQIWESDSCSDSGYNHRSNCNLPMFLPKKWPHRLLLLPKWKSDSGSGSGFSQIFDSGSGSERKTQNSAGINSGNPDPVPPLQTTRGEHGTMDRIRIGYPAGYLRFFWIRIFVWFLKRIFPESDSRCHKWWCCCFLCYDFYIHKISKCVCQYVLHSSQSMIIRVTLS